MSSRLLRKFRTGVGLPLRDWFVIWEAWWTLLAVDLRVRLLPYSFWRKRLLREVVAYGAKRPGARSPQEIGRLFRIAVRNHIRPMNCLRRAWALRTLLLRRGFAPRLVLGVRREGEKLAGHAWLELEGQVVNDAPDVAEQYVQVTTDTQAADALRFLD